jgi:carbamoyltransferase
MTATFVLGISAYFHDSAAALIRDGKIIAAASEERFSREKGDPGFPTHAVAYCLNEGGIVVEELSAVGFYDKPILKFDRILSSYFGVAPRGFKQFLKAGPLWVKDKLWTESNLRKELGGYKGKLYFAEHHESHAASAFYPSPFTDAAILTIDGVGEWATAACGVVTALT